MQEVPDDDGDNNNIEDHETPANAEILMKWESSNISQVRNYC